MIQVRDENKLMSVLSAALVSFSNNVKIVALYVNVWLCQLVGNVQLATQFKCIFQREFPKWLKRFKTHQTNEFQSLCFENTKK